MTATAAPIDNDDQGCATGTPEPMLIAASNVSM